MFLNVNGTSYWPVASSSFFGSPSETARSAVVHRGEAPSAVAASAWAHAVRASVPVNAATPRETRLICLPDMVFLPDSADFSC